MGNLSDIAVPKNGVVVTRMLATVYVVEQWRDGVVVASNATTDAKQAQRLEEFYQILAPRT